MDSEANAVPREFLELAADVFGVGVETLTPETAYGSIEAWDSIAHLRLVMGSIEAWDSVAHLRLVMETEAKFGKPIPLEAVPNLKTLSDFGRYC